MTVGADAALILDRAADLLVVRGWTRGAMARDIEGNPVPEGHSDAACFCMLGALSRAFIEIDGVDVRALDAAIDSATSATLSAGGVGIPDFNDRVCGGVNEAAGIFRKAREHLFASDPLGDAT